MSAFGAPHLVLAALLVCCGGQVPFDGTLAVTEVVREGQVALLTAVKAEAHSGFDRVTFTFEGPDRPGHHISYIDAPATDCGAGDNKPIAGNALLEVRLYPTYAHTEAGQPTIPFREMPFDHPALVELERTCDFEAVTTWVLGLRARTPYRVSELTSPSRLVVDIAHGNDVAGTTTAPTTSASTP